MTVSPYIFIHSKCIVSRESRQYDREKDIILEAFSSKDQHLRKRLGPERGVLQLS